MIKKHFAPGATVSPEVFCLVKKLEAVIVGKKYSVDGEVFVCKRGDVPFELPLEIEDYIKITPALREIHISAMNSIYLLVQDIRTKPHRAVPLTRDELEERGVSKKTCRQLCDLGLVQEHLIPLMRKSEILGADGNPAMKSVGVKSCITFTNQGRAYVRAVIASEYGTAGREHWDGVRDAAEEFKRGADQTTRGLSVAEPSIPRNTGDDSGGLQPSPL